MYRGAERKSTAAVSSRLVAPGILPAIFLSLLQESGTSQPEGRGFNPAKRRQEQTGAFALKQVHKTASSPPM
jgi:hypothetical protein